MRAVVQYKTVPSTVVAGLMVSRFTPTADGNYEVLVSEPFGGEIALDQHLTRGQALTLIADMADA